MGMLSPARKLLKFFHPESIPWPGTVFYNMVSKTRIFQRHYDLIAEDITGYRSEGSILDIGTGPGWLLIKLHQISSRLQVTGLDVSPSMVTKARNNLAKAGLSHVIEVKEGNASSLPFGDCSFDVVVSTGSIHHWKYPSTALDEIHRVLKNGGYGLIYDLVSDTPASVLRETAREFGKLHMVSLWLHAFEEPFYSHKDFHLLADPTQFKEGQSRFVGAMCCLVLRK
ncbi:class I SAM-dependent methyltransferase [Candidatus Latescibacterota bacterium]